LSLYIHHVPGRLRVRAQAFRCQPNQVAAVARQLLAMDGVDDVKVNAHAGSITICYDPTQLTQGELLATMEGLGCVGAGRAMATDSGQLAGLFGKALLGALAQTVAQRSVATLVGALR
jgi:copper chaperone CopZ